MASAASILARSTRSAAPSTSPASGSARSRTRASKSCSSWAKRRNCAKSPESLRRSNLPADKGQDVRDRLSAAHARRAGRLLPPREDGGGADDPPARRADSPGGPPAAQQRGYREGLPRHRPDVLADRIREVVRGRLLLRDSEP